MTKDNYEYDILNSQSVESEITYVDDITTPNADGRVSKYTCTVKKGETVKTTAITDNTYDVYKRITNKNYTVGNKAFSKQISYDKTRPSAVVDKFGNTNIANTTYEYDALGRITCEKDGSNNVVKRYSYDTYGQLTREDNATLDKTYVYEYSILSKF